MPFRSIRAHDQLEVDSEIEELSVLDYARNESRRLQELASYLSVRLSIDPELALQEVYEAVGSVFNFQEKTLEEYYNIVELKIFDLAFQKNQRLLVHGAMLRHWCVIFFKVHGLSFEFVNHVKMLKSESDSRGHGLSCLRKESRDLGWYETQAFLNINLYQDQNFLDAWERCYIDNHWLYEASGSYSSAFIRRMYRKCHNVEERQIFLKLLFRTYINNRKRMHFIGYGEQVTVTEAFESKKERRQKEFDRKMKMKQEAQLRAERRQGLVFQKEDFESFGNFNDVVFGKDRKDI